MVFGRVATCGNCVRAHRDLDAQGCTYTSVDFGERDAYDRLAACAAAAGVTPPSSISMPYVCSYGGGSAGEGTQGWTTSYITRHHVGCR